MMGSIRAEFRKLLSVRSTLYLCGAALLMLLIFAFYINGVKADPKMLAVNSGHLAEQATQAVNALAAILGLAGLLLMTHEYRYNTIMYTLTASKSRMRILLAKIITVSGFIMVATVVVAILSPALAYLGIHLAGNHLIHQTIPLGSLLWRCLFYGWGYSMVALLLAAIIRSQVGALVAFLLIPITVEPLLTLVLKHSAVYLPFSALGQVVATPGADHGPLQTGSLTPSRGALVFGAYLVIGWIVAGILFLKRDAN